MIITMSEAGKIDKQITEGDIKAIEMAVIGQTNNHFHLAGYAPEVIGVANDKILFKGDNLFKVNDTIEIIGVQYYDGFHYVKEVGEGYISVGLGLDLDLQYQGKGGRIYLTKYPADVKAGALKVLEYQVKTKDKIGIRSESISRWSTTYEKPNSDSVGGVPAHLFDFLAPYEKMRWG